MKLKYANANAKVGLMPTLEIKNNTIAAAMHPRTCDILPISDMSILVDELYVVQI